MFSLLSKNKKMNICSPVTGKTISLDNVNDPIFSQRLMGDGIAFTFDDSDTLSAPCDGKVIAIPPTKHAIGIKASNGAEILIHVGFETCKLNGKGFEPLVKEGDKIKMNQPILKIDLQFMKEKEIDLITPMILTNSNDYELSISPLGNANQGTSVVMTCSKKRK